MKFSKGGNGGGGSFERPPTGYCVGVLAAIYDLGVRETPGSTFGPRHQVCFWWELSHKDSKGQPHQLRDVVTMSTMEGSNLSSRIEALIGRDLMPQERETFDPASVLGRCAKLLLAVSPKKPDGSPFVKAAMPAEAGDRLVVEGDYRAALPRFIERLVTEPTTLDRMKAEMAAGGGDLVLIAPKGQVILPGRAPAQAIVPPSAVVAPPPIAAKLPPGWRSAKTADGRAYFIGPDGRTTWDAPGQAAPPPPPPPPAPATDDDLPF